MPDKAHKHKELQVEEWIKKAREDELSVEDILESRHGSPSTVCFLSQQMAEKYFKAFLVFYSGQFPKIHSIDALWELCYEIDNDLKKIKESAVFLTTFYVATRYPGDFPNFIWKDAEAAFKSAQKIKKLILRKVRK